MKRFVTLAFAFALAGCAIEPTVPRAYDGKVVEGPFVPPEAYSAYLRGVLADEAGDLKSALAAYEETIREDDEDPEPFTRIGDVRCRLDPKNRAADDAFTHAAAIDPHYAPLLTARARCAAARGQPAIAVALVDAVPRSDRDQPSIEALSIALSKGASATTRARAVALTVAAGEHVVAWDALIAWARTHGDAQLLAAGLVGLLKVAPLRAGEVEAGAMELLGRGQTVLAREVAAAVADAPSDSGVQSVHDATVARLAVDEALVRADEAVAERRATRGHVGLAEVAARAALLERTDLAAALARRVLAADPSDGDAAMVVYARATASHPPAACALLMARRLADAGDLEAARAFVKHIDPEPIAPHDPLVGAVAVDLAVRGAVADAALPLELRLETAARRHDAPPPIDPAKVDEKHALLFHTLIDPAGAPARELLARLASAADRDPLIGFALARAALVAPPPSPNVAALVRAAVAAAPTDPLVLAAALELAKKSGHADELPPARARLMAVARTPAERALASSE